MKIAKLISLIGLLGMTGILVYGFTIGDFSGEGARLLAMPWGIVVLGSYVLGIFTHPNAGQVLWGGIPQSIRPFYTAGMFLAATGYFAFTYFLLFRLNPQDTHVTSRLGFGLFNILYALILFPSALWMPLTFLAIEQSSLLLVWVVRLVLVVVGAASICLFIALLKVIPRKPLWAYRIALAGVVAFCVQTAILDAIIWGAFFRL